MGAQRLVVRPQFYYRERRIAQDVESQDEARPPVDNRGYLGGFAGFPYQGRRRLHAQGYATLIANQATAFACRKREGERGVRVLLVRFSFCGNRLAIQFRTAELSPERDLRREENLHLIA